MFGSHPGLGALHPSDSAHSKPDLHHQALVPIMLARRIVSRIPLNLIGSARFLGTSARLLSPDSKNFYSFFPATFPQGGPPNSPFIIDPKTLRREFLQAQSKVHPDKAGSLGADRDDLERQSSQLNTAYKAILNPLLRAEHLLQQQGIDALSERETLVDEDLLMDVLMSREAISEISTREEWNELAKENDGKIANSEQLLEKAFAEGDLETARLETVKLSYWMNIQHHLKEAEDRI